MHFFIIINLKKSVKYYLPSHVKLHLNMYNYNELLLNKHNIYVILNKSKTPVILRV